MRKFLLLLGATAIAWQAHGQMAITLVKTNITGINPGLIHLYTANISSVTSPDTGANKTWDYSSLKAASSASANLVAAPSFSPTAVVDTSTSEVVIRGTESVKAGIVYDLDNNGFFIAGRMLPAQAYSEAPLSGNPKDSSYWLAQNYVARENMVTFPATIGSAWKTTNVHPLNSLITVAALSLNKSSAKVVVRSYISDTVVGWGTLKIPDEQNIVQSYNVLLVRKHTVSSDSFYLNGQPALPFILAAFSSKQNDTSLNIYQEFFYREGTGLPIMTINYNNDSTYARPVSATYNGDVIHSGIEPVGYDPDIFNVYPNPSNPGPVHIRLHKNSEKTWHLMVVNSLGQLVKTDAIDGNGNIDLRVDASGFKSGLYFLQVCDNYGHTRVSSRLNIVY